MAKWLTTLLVLFSLSFCVEIISDRVRSDEEGNIIAEGNVQADYKDYLVSADMVKYNPKTKEVFAYGNVHIRRKDGSFEVVGTQAYVNLREEKGYFLDAQGRFRKFYFSAKKVEKVDKEIYHVYEGDVTTCPPNRKEMKLCFLKARVSDKYVLSLSNSMKFFGVPFFYLPFAVFPIGERRSGLLPPMIGQDSYNNIIYIQPLYWAISKDKDATFTLDYRDRQAKGVSLEYRQAIDPGEGVYMRLSYYKEPTPPGEWWQGRNLETFRENRFRLEFNMGFKGWKLGLDIPSDPYFFEDVYFSQNIASYLFEDIYFSSSERTTPYTLSYITYTKYEKDYLFTLNLRSYYDLTSDNNRKSLSLLPELGFYSVPKRVGPLFVSLTTTFTNFYRDEGLRSQRLIFMPEMQVPVNLLGLNNYTSIKLLNNFYFINGTTEELDERVGTILVENRTPFFKTLSLGPLALNNVLELVYRFSPENFNTPQFDSFDVVTQENNGGLRYTASLSYREKTLSSLFIEGSYNFLGSYRFPTDGRLIEKELTPIRAILSVYPAKWLTLREDATYDANLGVLARSVSGVDFNLWRIRLNASYVTSKNSLKKRSSDQYTLGGELNLWLGLLVGGSTTKDNITGKELYRRVYAGIRGSCWSLQADYRRTYYGQEKGYIRELFVVFNIFNLRDFRLPLRRK